MEISNLSALQAQANFTKLMEVDLPVKISLDIALVSNLVDEQVNTFIKVRDNLFKKYGIKTSSGDEAGTTKFESTLGESDKEKQANLETFVNKFNELLETKGEDLIFKKIKLPSDIKIKPEILKSLVEFVGVE